MEVAGPRLIAEGDLVVVYERHDSMKPVHVMANGKYDNRFAHFKMQVRLLHHYALNATQSDPEPCPAENLLRMEPKRGP